MLSSTTHPISLKEFYRRSKIITTFAPTFLETNEKHLTGNG
jgi:hypothetical protein